MVDRPTELEAAVVLRTHIEKLKGQAKASDSRTAAPMLWLRVRDLERLVQMLEDGELSENP